GGSAGVAAWRASFRCVLVERRGTWRQVARRSAQAGEQVGAVARYLWRFESWPAPRSSLGAVLRRVVTSTDCVRGWLSPAGGGVIAAPLRPPLAANARLPGRRSAVSHPGALCPECSRLSLWSVAPPAQRPGSTGSSG